MLINEQFIKEIVRLGYGLVNNNMLMYKLIKIRLQKLGIVRING